jgi:hypothetical protein
MCMRESRRGSFEGGRGNQMVGGWQGQVYEAEQKRQLGR